MRTVQTPGFIGARLRQAREARGIQQIELADMLGLHRQQMSQYENDHHTPSRETLVRAAEILRLPRHFFMRPVSGHFTGEAIFYRSLKSAGKVDRQRAEARLEWVAELLDYLSEYIDLPTLSLDLSLELPSDPNLISDEMIENAAKELRHLWKLGDRPIPYVVRLFEANGAIVVVDDFEAPELDGISAWSKISKRPFMMLNKGARSAARNHFNAAHEMGELLLHRNVTNDIASNPKMTKLLDTQAHKFAGAFLLPERAFLSDLYTITLESLEMLKQKWKVSIGAMIERLKQLGIISDSKYHSLRVGLSRRGWNKVEPYDDVWQAEQPILMKQSLELLVSEGIQNSYDILHNSALDERTLIRLACLDEDFFKSNEQPRNIIKLSAV